MPEILEKIIAQNAEPEESITFLCEGNNWIVHVPYEQIYSELKFEEICEDVCLKSINYLFLNRSNLELKVDNLDENPPSLGIVLLIKVLGKTKEFLIPTHRILRQASCTELANKYQQKLNEILAEEES